MDGLGLFEHVVGSSEPEDDESCFANASGRWLLRAVHWDLLAAWLLPEKEAQAAALMQLQQQPTIYRATAVSTITNIASNTQVSFAASVPGAAVGDAVIATPPNALTVRIATYALVTAPETVTVYLNNSSSTAATLSAGTWAVAVIKE